MAKIHRHSRFSLSDDVSGIEQQVIDCMECGALIVETDWIKHMEWHSRTHTDSPVYPIENAETRK